MTGALKVTGFTKLGDVPGGGRPAGRWARSRPGGSRDGSMITRMAARVGSTGWSRIIYAHATQGCCSSESGKTWAISSAWLLCLNRAWYRFRRGIHIVKLSHGVEHVAHRTVGWVWDGGGGSIIQRGERPCLLLTLVTIAAVDILMTCGKVQLLQVVWINTPHTYPCTIALNTVGLRLGLRQQVRLLSIKGCLWPSNPLLLILYSCTPAV